MQQRAYPYWLEVPPVLGQASQPQDGGILIIGSGLSGVSCAYWLQEAGFDNLTLVDYEPEKAASFRNCGHILYGTVESMQALVALYGQAVAQEVWSFSIDVCHALRDTVARLGVEVDYHQDGYLVMAIDEAEVKEIQESVGLLNSLGFASEYWDAQKLAGLGFRQVLAGRFEPGSAQGHPVKFRNAVLAAALNRGLRYHSPVQVTAVEAAGSGVEVTTQAAKLHFDAVVIASNAYSPLLSSFFARHRLVEPFRGQIITSAPLRQHQFAVRYPHSFDHGYEYALVTADNRLMMGGWRNKTPAGEVGTYDLRPNPQVEAGLAAFVREHYAIAEPLRWDYSWSGIMASSRTGLPFIGPTHDERIFTCAGYTGHGFSWAHGSAKLLADIMAGNKVPPIARLFRPATV